MKRISIENLNFSSQEIMTREKMKNVLGGYGQEWLCDCVDSIYPDQCYISGEYESNFEFHNCCGYSGPVAGGGANPYVNFCQTYTGG